MSNPYMSKSYMMVIGSVLAIGAASELSQRVGGFNVGPYGLKRVPFSLNGVKLSAVRQPGETVRSAVKRSVERRLGGNTIGWVPLSKKRGAKSSFRLTVTDRAGNITGRNIRVVLL